MPKICVEDQYLIKSMFESKKYGARKIKKEFPGKSWSLAGISNIIRKVKDTGTITRRKGSGRPKTVRTEGNIETVNEMIISQENRPGTHKSQREISRETGIHRSSVQRIVKKDLQLINLRKQKVQELTEANKAQRLTKCRKLLRRYPQSKVNTIWFSDEKNFTLTTPVNRQNSRVYVKKGTKKSDVNPSRIAAEKATFSKSVMVSLAVSKFGKSRLHFIDPGVKVNAIYYRNKLMSTGLLPDMREKSQGHWVFQQDSAPAHRAKETIEFLQREVPELIDPDLWPANSPDLNPVDYRVWGNLQEMVYK
jgi:hypothetical protein